MEHSVGRVSHVLCKVDDLAVAVRAVTAAGFEVTWGSAPYRAHNALVWFTAGPFIELYTARPLPRLARALLAARYGRGVAARLRHWTEGPPGWRDVAVEARIPTPGPLLGQRVAELRTAGLDISGPVKRRRVRPDGAVVRWSLALPHRPGLPFVMSDYDPPQRPATVTHPNGARRITGIGLDVADADRAAWATLCGDGHADLWVAPGPYTRIREVTIDGLTAPIEADMLAGAAIRRAGRSGRADA